MRVKEILILNSFSFEEKEPRFIRLKPGVALRSFSKGLFYIRAMEQGMRLGLILGCELCYFSWAKIKFNIC